MLSRVTGIFVLVLALTAGAAGPVPMEQCSYADYAAGRCGQSVSTDGTDVNLAGSVNTGTSGDDARDASPGNREPQVIWDPANRNPCDAPGGWCVRPELPGEPADPGLPAVTLADLESFRPVTPALTGEPAGFGVVGMPTNFVAAASEQAIPGVLLGYPVTVRFTPTAFVFSYGDGTSARSATGGATWAQVGTAQFSPTDTTHVYRERGIYSATVAVEFAASVDFGTGWIPVDGVVTASSGAYPVEVVEVHTALVDRTCEEDPTGPGCG